MSFTSSMLSSEKRNSATPKLVSGNTMSAEELLATIVFVYSCTKKRKSILVYLGK
jgi:hypothetical protein